MQGRDIIAGACLYVSAEGWIARIGYSVLVGLMARGRHARLIKRACGQRVDQECTARNLELT